MLPFGGQGSNQAIEDAGALGYLLKGVGTAEAIQQRLDVFVRVRQKRAARVQILSSVRAGKEASVQSKLEKFADPIGSGKYHSRCDRLRGPDIPQDVPNSFPKRNEHDYGCVCC